MKWANVFRVGGRVVPFLLIFGLGVASQAAAQTAPSCSFTAAELNSPAPGGLSPGGLPVWSITLGTNSVTIDAAGTGNGGTDALSVWTPAPINAVVTVPPFTQGTGDPIVVTYTITNPTLAIDFTLRVATVFHAITVRVQCAGLPPPPSVCVLTQGFWKNHPDSWPVTSLKLGTVTYTKAQLISILQTPVKGNGLISLSYQLIAAKLNAAGGATVPGSVQTAMAQADALIGSKVVPPIGAGFLDPSATSGLTTTLDTFNNGNTPGGPPHCDS